MIRIFHLITTLETGGAELFLYRLASGLAKQGFVQHVAAMVPSEPVDALLRGQGIPVSFLGLRPGRPNPLAILRFLRLLREFRPHVLQTWLYHADLLGLFGRLAGVRRLVWNIRCTDMDFSRYSPLTGLTVKLCASLSRLPTMVLTNACAARDFHLRSGYRPREFRVIPNGYDLSVFKPDPEARLRLRRAMGVADDDVLVGLAARYDPMKGHEIFARAAGLALQRCPNLRFVLYGAGIEPCNATLVAQLRESNAHARTLLLGRRDDIETLHAAMDIGLSASCVRIRAMRRFWSRIRDSSFRRATLRPWQRPWRTWVIVPPSTVRPLAAPHARAWRDTSAWSASSMPTPGSMANWSVDERRPRRSVERAEVRAGARLQWAGGAASQPSSLPGVLAAAQR